MGASHVQHHGSSIAWRHVSRKSSSDRYGLLCLGLAIFLALGCQKAVEPTPRAEVRDFENLLVIMIDTLRSDHLPSYGYERPTAPFLSQMASEGIQLQGYAASSWTRSSVATLLTGLYPQRHQAIGRNDKLPDAVPYLPELLAEHGFHNLAFVTNGNVSQQFGFDRGYSGFEERFHFGKPEARQIADEVLARSGELRSPFYLYIHLIDPHDPYVPKQAWQRPDADPADFIQPGAIKSGEIPLDDHAVSWMIDQYDAEILEMDRAIQKMIEGLEAAGVLDSTLVVVTADHGEEFGERGGVGHGTTLHEEVIRVPYVLWASDGLPVYQSASAFHQVDFLPTTLEALGVAAPPGLDGASLWAALQDPGYRSPDERLFHLEIDGHQALAMMTPQFKVIRRQQEPQELAYDLARNPDELTGEANSELDAEQAKALRRRMVRLDRQLKKRRFKGETTEATGVVRQQLAALGYLGGDDGGQPSFDREALYGVPLDATLAVDQIVSSDLDLRERSKQQLQGWIFKDPNGTWSAPRARLVLAIPQGASEIVLAGHSVAARAEALCRVEIDGALVHEVTLLPGRFEIAMAIPEATRNAGYATIDLTVDPPLQVPGIESPAGLHWNRALAR
ncbi:MAG: sulfatase [Acidobacteriota bacterium]